jgi:hypothetical protein
MSVALKACPPTGFWALPAPSKTGTECTEFSAGSLRPLLIELSVDRTDTVDIVDWLEVEFPFLRSLPFCRVGPFVPVFVRSVGKVFPRTLPPVNGFVLGEKTPSSSEPLDSELELEELDSLSSSCPALATAAAVVLAGTTFRGPFMDETILLKNELNIVRQLDGEQTGWISVGINLGCIKF